MTEPPLGQDEGVSADGALAVARGVDDAPLPGDGGTDARRKRVLSIVVIVACIAGAAAVYSQQGFELDPRILREQIADFGWLAPAVFVVAAALRFFLLLPSWVFMTVGGLLFGFWGGVLWGSIGFALGAVLSFSIARGLGRDALAARLRGRAARFDRYVTHRGAPWIALYTAVPVSVLTPVHFGAGLSGMPLGTFAVAAVCGFLPRTALYSFFGDSIAQNDWGGAGVALTLIVVGGAVGIVLAQRWRSGPEPQPDADVEKEDRRL